MRKERHLFPILMLTLLLSAFLSVSVFAASPKLSRKNVSLYVRQSATLKMTGTSKKVTWSTSKKTVATVNQKGKVTAVGAGTATITARAGGKSDTCKVTVKKPSIKLNKKTASLYLSGTKTLQLKATVKGAGKKVRWKSSNSSVAAVSAKGKVTAKKTGTVTITAKANGVSASCKITIKEISDRDAALKSYGNVLENNKVYEKFLVKNLMGNAVPELLVWGSSEGGFLHLLQYNASSQKTSLITTGTVELYINKDKKAIISHDSYGGDIYTVTDFEGKDLVSYSHYDDGSCYKNEEVVLTLKKFRSSVNSYLKSAAKYSAKSVTYKNTGKNRKKYLK